MKAMSEDAHGSSAPPEPIRLPRPPADVAALRRRVATDAAYIAQLEWGLRVAHARCTRLETALLRATLPRPGTWETLRAMLATLAERAREARRRVDDFERVVARLPGGWPMSADTPRPVRRTITIMTGPETTEPLTASVYGQLAVHGMPIGTGRQSEDNWTVTHVPTGAAVATYLTEHEARAIARQCGTAPCWAAATAAGPNALPDDVLHIIRARGRVAA